MATQPTEPKPRQMPPGLASRGADGPRHDGSAPGGRSAPEGRLARPDGSARETRSAPAGRSSRSDGDGFAARALLLWPGLDRTRLALARGNPERITRLVAQRTSLPPETIMRMLGVRSVPLPAIDGDPDGEVRQDA